MLELRMFFKAQAIYFHLALFFSGLNVRISALCAVFCERKPNPEIIFCFFSSIFDITGLVRPTCHHLLNYVVSMILLEYWTMIFHLRKKSQPDLKRKCSCFTRWNFCMHLYDVNLLWTAPRLKIQIQLYCRTIQNRNPYNKQIVLPIAFSGK